MITLLDNRQCDHWWEELLPYVTKIDWERHSLTPELVKFQLLLNKWAVFKGENCLWIGYFTYTPKKHFFVTFVAGYGLINEIGHFIEYLVKHFACNYLTGITLLGMARLYRQLNISLRYGKISNSNYYEIDLIKYPYIEQTNDAKVEWQSPFYINNWIDQISCDIIPRDFINEIIFVYKVGPGFVIGSVINDLTKKYFKIVYISSDIRQEDMAAFFYFVETQIMCRYVNYSDSLDCLFSIDSEGVRKFGLTTFERDIKYDNIKGFLP